MRAVACRQSIRKVRQSPPKKFANGKPKLRERTVRCRNKHIRLHRVGSHLQRPEFLGLALGLLSMSGTEQHEYCVICEVRGRVHLTVQATSPEHARQLVADYEGVEYMPADLTRGRIVDVWSAELSRKGAKQAIDRVKAEPGLED